MPKGMPSISGFALGLSVRMIRISLMLIRSFFLEYRLLYDMGGENASFFTLPY